MAVQPRQRKISAIVSKLLEWFPKNARDLPWRRTRDPYAIWVSEVMLQQTQVKTVVPYWQRWMRALPMIEAVASARPERIHKLWEGLGYYTRARNLHKAAQAIVVKHGGRFPRRFNEVLALSGIGRYTAGAICSIAFDQPTPILDGNVVRVLSRLFAISGNPRAPRVNDCLWHLARRLVLMAATLQATPGGTAPRFCSQLNQSLMELGAVICTPRQPRCSLCPIVSHCRAFRESRVNEFPQLGARPHAIPRRFIALVVQRRGRVLARQRPAGVVNAHLWEFPNTEVAPDKSRKSVRDGAGEPRQQWASSPRPSPPAEERKKSPPPLIRNESDLRRVARRLLGLAPVRLGQLCTIKHSITRYRITLEVFRATFNQGAKPAPDGAHWLSGSQLRRLPFASAHKRILEVAIDSRPR